MNSSKLILSFFLFVLTNVLVFGQCSIPITATPDGLGTNGVYFQAPTIVGGQPAGYYNWNFGDGSSTALVVNNIVHHSYFQPGTYTATLTTYGFIQCTDSVSITVSDTSLACIAGFNVLPVFSAFGTDYTFIGQAAGGTPPYSYLWSTGDVGQTLNYSPSISQFTMCLQISDSANQCTATFCDTIYQGYPILIYCFSVTQPTSGCNGVLAISNDFISSSCEGTLVAYPPGSVDFSSMWVNGDTLFFNTCDTVYSIGVVDSTGTLCSYSIVDSLISTASIIEMEKNDYAISPIPNNGEFKLHGKVNHGDRLQLTNLYGKTVYQQVLDEPSNLTMVRVDLSPGTYTLTLKNAEGGETYRNKIVIIQ